MGRRHTRVRRCQAELLKAKAHMGGRPGAKAAPAPDPGGGAAVSNPVDFLVPRAMDSVALEEA